MTTSAKIKIFAGANLDRLARDMAHGQGETLDTFAHLLKISESDKAAFGQFSRAKFAEIFAGEDVTAEQMLISLEQLMNADPRLTRYVRS